MYKAIHVVHGFVTKVVGFGVAGLDPALFSIPGHEGSFKAQEVTWQGVKKSGLLVNNP